MKIAISSQPETISQLLIRSITLYRLVIGHVFFLALTLAFVFFIPRLLTLMIGQDIFGGLSLLNINRLWILIINLGALTLFAAILWRIRCIIIDEHESILDDMEIALKKLPHIFVAVLIQFLLAYFVIFVFLFIAMYFVVDHSGQILVMDFRDKIITSLLLLTQFFIVIYFFFAFYFYLPIITIENKSIFNSLSKSLSLVWRNWWRTVSVQMTPWITYLLTLITIRLITRINIHIYFFESLEGISILATLLQLLIFAAFVPWFGTTMLVQLRDLELRKQLMA